MKIMMLGFLLVSSQLQAAQLWAVNKDGDDVSVIDLKQGQVIKNVAVGQAPHELAITPNQKHMVVTNYGRGCGSAAGDSLTVINTTDHSAKTIDIKPFKGPHGVWVLKDNTTAVVSVECSDALVLVDIEKGTLIEHIETQAKVSHMVAITPDERLAFTANIGSGSISVLDLVNKKHIQNITTGAGAEGIDVSPDGKQVWVSNRAADTVSVIDVASLKIVKSIAVKGFPIRVKFHPNGKQVFVSNATAATVAVIDAQSHQITHQIAMTEEKQAIQSGSNALSQGAVPIGLVISQDGKTAYVANTNVDEIRVIDLNTMKVTGVLKAGKRPDGLALLE